MAVRIAVAACMLGALAEGIARHETPKCYDTVEGEPCWKAIQWAQKKGMWKNPEWYVEVQNPLDEAEMQNFFFKQRKHDCMRPCRLAVETTPAPEGKDKDGKKDWKSYFK
mmetsp:Transcript_71545/g.202927  ORF Transcript_71545/g.202927 Transcript_71545/m.202927 type:complete len:110 (-) Transcript_71545:90-419(-)